MPKSPPGIILAIGRTAHRRRAGRTMWYFKDPATGQWNGIGYNVGKVLAKDLGVKLVPVETTWKCGRRAAGRAD